ncbi:MAG: hypothetical protein EBY22_17895, partial [Gammaproteobacteria bacterium]|nr:hypothetical protein [Gammaproteobacteria bacterium]
MNTKINRDSLEPTGRNVRKKILPLILSAVVVLAGGSELWAANSADINFTSGSYTNGTNLVGQNGWATLGATTTSPIQVTSNGVALVSVASAQSAYKKYSPYQLASAGRVFIRLDINVSAATNGYDIFLVNREYDNVSTNSTYLQPAGKSHFRTFIKSTNNGYVIGW